MGCEQWTKDSPEYQAAYKAWADTANAHERTEHAFGMQGWMEEQFQDFQRIDRGLNWLDAKPSAETMADFAHFIKTVEDAPCAERTLYRGLGYRYEDTYKLQRLEKLQPGDIMTLDVTQSGTESLMYAERYSNVGKTATHRVVWEIESQTGVDLKGITNYEEVLLRKGTRLEFLGRERVDGDVCKHVRMRFREVFP